MAKPVALWCLHGHDGRPDREVAIIPQSDGLGEQLRVAYLVGGQCESTIAVFGWGFMFDAVLAAERWIQANIARPKAMWRVF